MLFSIIIPVYNVENYLERCLESVIGQNYHDFEVILINDGGTDKSAEICDRFAKNDNRIRVIHQENRGVSMARNVGISSAKGDYLMFLDSDDYISSDALESLSRFADNEVDVIIGDGISERSNHRLRHDINITVSDGKSFLKKAIAEDVIPMVVWLHIYRNQFVKDNQLQFMPNVLHEDEEFVPRAFLCANKVVNTHICFYHYVVREGSITTAEDLRKNVGDLYVVCRRLYGIYEQINDVELKNLLIDSLAVKYLSLFQIGRMYRYGEEYIQRMFVLKCAKRGRTRAKAILYCMNPKLYWNINHWTKSRKCK